MVLARSYALPILSLLLPLCHEAFSVGSRLRYRLTNLKSRNIQNGIPTTRKQENLLRMVPFPEKEEQASRRHRRRKRRRRLPFNLYQLPPDAFSFKQKQLAKYLRIHQTVRKRRSFRRLTEIASILLGQVLRPLLCSLTTRTTRPMDDRNIRPGSPLFDWNAFMTEQITAGKTNAQRLVEGFQQLGPTYVKLGQALSTRPDFLNNQALSTALTTLQGNMRPFEDRTARRIIYQDLFQKKSHRTRMGSSATTTTMTQSDQRAFLDSLSARPVAAASMAQVYKGYVPGFGSVAVKVQRPGIRGKVERDATLFHSAATWLQSVNRWPRGTPWQGQPLIEAGTVGTPSATAAIPSSSSSRSDQLVRVADEFTARVLEDMDFEREAANMQAFGELYSYRGGLSTSVKVVVPELIPELCSKRVIVMEWIEGTKLTDICVDCDERELHVAENLALVQTAIECTLSQLLDTGLLHADPHTANLLKVRTDGGPKLGYLDFGLVNIVPQNVRDGIVCAVVQLVFAYNMEAVANLCVDLELLPKERIKDPKERKRFIIALTRAFDTILEWPRDKKGRSTAVPRVRFDKLASSLSALVTKFEFTVPPYGLNNARALVTLEGIARELDPSFNILRVIYPYSINRLMQNPAVSTLVEDTFIEMLRSPQTQLFDIHRFKTLLNDLGLFTGYRKRKIFCDLALSTGTRRVVVRFVREWCSQLGQKLKQWRLRMPLPRRRRRGYV